MAKQTDKITERNRAIVHALDVEKKTPKAVAKKYRMSYSNVFRAAAAGRALVDVAADDGPPARPRQPIGDRFSDKAVQNIFAQIGTTGLRRFGGSIDDEYERSLKSLDKRVALFREMGDDPIVAATLQGTKMTLRRVSFYADTLGTTDDDKRARDFVQQNLDDMSQSWSDISDQTLGMLQYGFSPAEMVFKRRQGPGRMVVDADGNECMLPGSKYDDGRIGWKDWIFISPDSLTPGNEWQFNEHTGELQGLWQTPPPSGAPRFIPAPKFILFRATAEKGNPEGRALLRPMYGPWYMKMNIQEIEGISVERLGSGFPVFYLGSDVSKNWDNPDSDAAEFRTIATNVRVDEQMGLVVPYAKMGGGAKEGEGVLFELVSPPGRGAVDFNQTIVRYEQRMSMVGLAQFIHLGMSNVGARALGETSLDFFTLAVSGWADSLADTITRQAVEPLMRLNYFPDMTCNPVIKHEPVIRASLKEVADYVNGLAGAQLITPGPELENYLREFADLPAKPVELTTPAAAEEDGLDLEGEDEGLELGGTDIEFFADVEDGIMIAFYPDKGTAKRLAVKDGETASALHVTLAYLGRQSQLSADQLVRLADVVRGFALISRPLAGTITGPAEFSPHKGMKPSVVLVDVPGLPAWRQRLVETLALNGIKVSVEHGYIPHITLKYTDENKPTTPVVLQEPLKVEFKEMALVIGSRRKLFELGGAGTRDDSLMDVFVAMRGAGTPGARTKEVQAVNAYQGDLETIYSDWADETAQQLADAKPDEREALLDLALLALLALLREAGRTSLPDAAALGAGDVPMSPDMLEELLSTLQESEAALEDTLIPAIRRKVQQALGDEDVAAALAAGAGAEALRGVLATMGGRVSAGSGDFWKLYNHSVGGSAREQGAGVIAYLDKQASHCEDCPKFHSVEGKRYDSIEAYLDATGNRMPGEFRCGGRCRCRIEVEKVKQQRA